jgi:hypothetical protein
VSDSLDHVRRLIHDTELQLRHSSQQPVVQQAGLRHVSAASAVSIVADALVHTDGITANYRSQSGPPPRACYTHPEQYDPVLRYHARMQPAADPHEDARRMHEVIRQQRNR